METINNTVINSVMKWMCAAVLLICANVSMWAGVVVFNANQEIATESGKLNTYTKENVKITATSMDNGSYYKSNKNATLKVESTNSSNITKIVIYTTDGSTYPSNGFNSVNTGSYSGSSSSIIGTWTGSATSITLTAGTSQMRMVRIEVTDGNSHDASDNPWFSVSPTSYSPADEDIEDLEANWASATFTVTKWTASQGDNIYVKIEDISDTEHFWFSIYNQNNTLIMSDPDYSGAFLVNHSENQDPSTYRFTLYCGAVSSSTVSCTANLVVYDYVRGGEITIPISLRAVAACTTYTITRAGSPAGTLSHGTISTSASSSCADESITLTATPATGYQLSSWDVYKTGTPATKISVTNNAFTMPAYAVTVDASFTAKSYDVKLNSNGGSGDEQTVTATYDAAMPLVIKTAGTAIVVPTKTGYSFGGYYDTNSSSGGTQYYSYSGSLASARTWNKANTATLYARWTANTTTITLDDNGGTNDGSATVKYDEGSVTISTTPTGPTGYHVEGYYLGSGSSTKILNPNGSFAAANITDYVTSSKWSYTTASTLKLYAHWEADEYDIIYKDGGNTDFSGDHESGYPTTHTYGSSTTLYDATKTGYTFGGWYDNSSCTGDEVETLGSTDYTDDITLYAKWTAKVITLTLDDNGGTSDGGGSVTFDGTSATISTDPVYGTKTIAGYYAEEGTTTKVLEADGSFAATDVTGYITSGKWSYSTATSLTLYTKWVTDNKVVTFNLHGHGGDNFTQNVENGQKAIRPSDPTDVDYNFDDWYTDDGGEPTNTKFDFANTTISAATTIHAKWTAKTYGDLFFACADISVACHDDGKTYITSSYHETSSVDDGVNIIGSRPIKVTVTGAIPGHVVDITSTGGLKFYKKVDGVYKDLSTNKLTAPLDGQEVYVSYKPTSAGTGEILTPTFTIKCDGHSQEFNGSGEYVKVRNLPATVAIVAKVGNTWHALSANITKSSTPLDEQIFTSIEDGEEGDVLTAHGSASELGYKLWPVKTTSGSADRFGTGSGASVAYGDRLRFAGKSDKALWANDLGESSSSKYNINNYAVVDAIDDDPAAPYEWKVTTTEVGGEFVYTLQTDQTNNTRYLRMYNGRWGTYLDEKGVNELYILPLIDTRLVDMEEYEWGTTSLAVTYTPGATPVALTKVVIGETTINAPTATLTNKGGDVWVLGGLCDLTAKPAEPMVVWLTENGSAKQAMLQVPFIVTSAKTEQNLRTSVSNDSKIYRHVDVIIRNGGTLTTEYDLGNFADLYIYPGGKAIVTNNMSFGAIHMRGGYSVLDNKATYKYPDLCIKSGTITTDSLTYDMFIDNRLYYMFSVPYDVALAGVTDEAGYDDFPVWVKHYNGALRASGHQVTGWEWYGDGPYQTSFKAGVGYEITAKPKTSGRPLAIIRFPVKSGDIESDEDNTASVSVSNYGYSAYQAGTQSANNVGWNFLGNPYLTEYKSTTSNSMMVQGDLVPHGDPWDGTYEWDETTVRYITVPYDMINDYHHEDVTDYTIPAFSTFFIQYTASASGTFVMGGTRTQASMPALRATQQSRPEVKLDVLLSGEGENEEGKTGLVIHDRYDGGYKDFEDVEQWFVGDGAQKTYTFASGIAVAYNLMDEDAASQLIPMGYIATVAGEHTYSLNENNDVSQVDHLWLTDYVSGTTTDLLLQDYTFTTESGRNDSRFALTVVFKQEGVYTDIDSAVGRDRETTRKFIYRDKMYILREGIIYDATGKRVREINK